MKLRMVLFIGLLLPMVLIVSACDGLPDIPDIGGDAEVPDGITSTLSHTYELATYNVYTSSYDYETTEDEFLAYIEDSGYTLATDDDAMNYSFFMQYGDTSSGGNVFEDDEHYKYVYITGTDESVTVITVEATKDDYQRYVDGNGEDNGTDNDNDTHATLPDNDVSGEDNEFIERYPDSVRISYLQYTDGNKEITYYEYLTDGDVSNVKDYYLDAINDKGYELEADVTHNDEHYLEINANDVNIIIHITTDSDGFTEVEFAIEKPVE